MTIFDEISNNYAFLDIEIKFSSWKPKESKFLWDGIAPKTWGKLHSKVSKSFRNTQFIAGLPAPTVSWMKNMEALHYSEDHITVDTFGTLHIRGRHFSQGADPLPSLHGGAPLLRGPHHCRYLWHTPYQRWAFFTGCWPPSPPLCSHCELDEEHGGSTLFRGPHHCRYLQHTPYQRGGSRSKDLEPLLYSEGHITVDTFGTLHIRGRNLSQGADPLPSFL